MRNKKKIRTLCLFELLIVFALFVVPASDAVYEVFWNGAYTWGGSEKLMPQLISALLFIGSLVVFSIKAKECFVVFRKGFHGSILNTGRNKNFSSGNVHDAPTDNWSGNHPQQTGSELDKHEYDLMGGSDVTQAHAMNGSFDTHGGAYGMEILSNHVNHASISGNTFGIDSHTNPANGAPMNGGVDAYGNTYGTDIHRHNHEVQTNSLNDWNRQ